MSDQDCRDDSGSDPEFDLVRQAKAEDKESLGDLLERHRYRVTSLVYLRRSDALAAKVELDDCVQEVFLRAIRSLDRFEWRGTGSFFRWLGGIADHVIKDLARYHFGTGRANEVRLEIMQQNGADIPAGGLTASGAVRRDERFERLRVQLHALPEAYREVILLARIRGLPMREVAMEMERSEDAVSSLLRRALERLGDGGWGTSGSNRLPPRSLD